MMFSATFPRDMRELAMDFMDPKFLCAPSVLCELRVGGGGRGGGQLEAAVAAFKLRRPDAELKLKTKQIVIH